MKRVVSIIIVLAFIAGTVLAVKYSRSKTFAQENLEVLAAGELTPEALLELCTKHCVLDYEQSCTPTDTGYPFPVTCVNHRILP